MMNGARMMIQFSSSVPKPGDDVDATPHLQLASGLYLANCTTRLGDAAREQERSAGIVLKSVDGAQLDRAVSGFA